MLYEIRNPTGLVIAQAIDSRTASTIAQAFRLLDRNQNFSVHPIGGKSS